MHFSKKKGFTLYIFQHDISMHKYHYTQPHIKKTFAIIKLFRISRGSSRAMGFLRQVLTRTANVAIKNCYRFQCLLLIIFRASQIFTELDLQYSLEKCYSCNYTLKLWQPRTERSWKLAHFAVSGRHVLAAYN